MPRTLQAGEVHDFVEAYARHIAEEEAALKDLFERWIDEGDRRALGRSMSARHAVSLQPPL
jgi:lysophospholipase L1-like esterase